MVRPFSSSGMIKGGLPPVLWKDAVICPYYKQFLPAPVFQNICSHNLNKPLITGSPIRIPYMNHQHRGDGQTCKWRTVQAYKNTIPKLALQAALLKSSLKSLVIAKSLNNISFCFNNAVFILIFQTLLHIPQISAYYGLILCHSQILFPVK